VKLTPEDFEKIEARRLANVLRKVNAGERLTKQEEAFLEREKAKATGKSGLVPVEAPQTGYVSNWDDLAKAASIDRRTLTNVRKRFVAEIKALGTELTRTDGRHVVAAWLAFLDEKGVRGKGINNPETTPEDYVDERQLRLRRERVQLDKAEFELAKAKEALLPVVDFQSALQVTIGEFNAVVNQLPGRASGKIVQRARAALLRMLKLALPAKTFEKVEAAVQTAPIDFADIEEILQEEVDHAKRTLAACEYLQPEDRE
jgi:hypothetical protein